MNVRVFRKNPYLYIFGSYITAILVGAFFLSLPISTYEGISVIDAFYTATSAICVTGLTVLNIGRDFTSFGQGVVLLLIQIGGLGIIIVSSMVFLAFRREFSFLNQFVIEESLTTDRRINTKRLVVYVVAIALVCEFIGAILLYSFFSKDYQSGTALYNAVFHSVSAFCNAGFSVFSNSLQGYSNHLGVNLTMMGLIFIGGIGYFCIIEFIRNFRSKKLNITDYRFSIHTRAAFFTSIALITIGAALFFIFEYENLMLENGFGDSVLISFFHSVSARTAGFSTTSFSKIGHATILLFGVLMIIGANPSSCGGGIKTTTFLVLLKYFIANLKNRDMVFLFNRTVPRQIVKKTILLVIIASTWVFCATILLTIFEEFQLTGGNFRLEDIIFEVISALGTVGLSTGITTGLSTASKTVIIFTMYFGKTGLLTLASFFAFTIREERFSYPEEDIFVG